MKHLTKLLFFLSFIFFISPSQAQDFSASDKASSFKLSGQFRSRLEYRDGYSRPLSKSEEPAALIQNRVRINLDYSYKNILKTKFTLQNVNIWGQANPFQVNDKSGNTLAVSEAWAAVKMMDHLWMKAGRQVMSYEDGRLFSAADWTNSGRTHDALSVHYKKNRFSADAFFAFNQNYEGLYNNNVNNPSGNLYHTADAHNYKTMQTLWAAYQTDDYSHLSVLFSNIGYQDAMSLQDREKVDFLQTTGLFYAFNYPKIFGSVSGFYQFGQSLGAEQRDAYVWSVNVGTFIGDKTRISIGSDYVSGNSRGVVQGKNNAFQTLYGTGHKFYGNMDYFGYLSLGLVDYHLGLQYPFNEKITGNITGHFFSVPTELNGFSSNLGQEIDAKLDMKLQKSVTLSLGYSTYFTTSTLLSIKNITDDKKLQHWAWLSLNVTPEFFHLKF